MSDTTTPALDRSLVRGIAWTGGVRWLAQIVSWGATLVVARLLTPADYGLVGMALIAVGVAQMVGEAGLVAALVQNPDLDEERTAQLGGLALLQATAACALTVALAGPLAVFFGEPGLHAVAVALSAAILVKGIQVLPRACLARALEFRRLAWLEGIEALSTTACTLAGALLGMRHWALILGHLGGAMITTGVALWWGPHRVAWPRDWAALAPAIRLGWHLVGTALAWYAYTNADLAVVGRILGKAALGTYTFAWTIASIPVDRVSGLVGRVTPAVFAAVQRDAAALRRYMARLTEGIALVAFPLCFGAALVADHLVPVLLGAGWEGAVMPLRVLAVYAGIRSVLTLPPQLLVVTGRSALNFRFAVLAALLLPVAFIVGSRWGTTGVALGWLIGYPLVAFPTVVRSALRGVGMSWGEFAAALRPAAIASGVMAAGVLALAAVLPVAWSPSERLALQVATGAALYAASAALLAGHRARALWALLRSGEPDRAKGPVPFHATDPAHPTHRLLLVSPHFPPDAAVGARRWQKLTRLAAERGWGLDVITRHPVQLERCDPALLHDLPAGVRLFGVPVRPLLVERLEHAVARACRGFRSNGDRQRPDSVRRVSLGWVPRTPRDVLRAYFAWVDHARGVRWARAAARLATEIVEGGVHRAVVTCGPPHGAHLAGERVARRTGLPLVMDLRDPWSLVERVPEAVASPVWFALAARAERRVVERAALVVANTEPARDAMARIYPKAASRIVAVPNGCDEETPPASHGPQFLIAYAGSIYLDRDPRLLFRAVAQLVRRLALEPSQIGIEFMGAADRFEGVSVERIARQEGVEAFVRVHPVRPRAEACRFLSGAAVLVVLPQDSHLAIPAKVFEYMQFEAWLLALAAKGSATEQLLRSSDADVVDPEDVAATAAALQRRYEAYRRGARPPRLAADERFSRRHQAGALFGAVEAIVSENVLCAAS